MFRIGDLQLMVLISFNHVNKKPYTPCLCSLINSSNIYVTGWRKTCMSIKTKTRQFLEKLSPLIFPQHMFQCSTKVECMYFLGNVQCYVPKPVKEVDTSSQNSKETKILKHEVKASSTPLELKVSPMQPGPDSSMKTKDNGERSYFQFRTKDVYTTIDNYKLIHDSKNMALDLMKSENLHETWDGWPDGDFELDIDHGMFEAKKNLMVLWSMKVNGGDKVHFADVETWQAGKRLTCLCLGYMKCDKETCHIIIRPKVDKPSREKQLGIFCCCGGNMVWKPCSGGPDGKGIHSVLHHWRGGVHYSNGGYHHHPHLTHDIHLTPKAELEFRELASSQPHLKALALIIGHPTLQGPHGKPVADLSQSLMNAGRFQYERSKIRKSSGKKGSFSLHVQQSDKGYNHWQTGQWDGFSCCPWLVEKTNVRMLPSHYINFFGHERTLQVVDFSEGERSGYLLAFAKFCIKQGDSRTQEQLLGDGAKLLKGFTVIKRIGSIIPVQDESKFKKLAMKLFSVPDQEEFKAVAHLISQQIMDAKVWDSIPGSTNAEEAMHWKLYSGVGCNHDVIEGFEGLLSMANYYERLKKAALVGSPTRYGQPEPWKVYSETIGRTKLSRLP
ncbi:hypothetical protein DFS33DRAFT_1276243 [Desarmillaria ectypa]|nr:hypothetical protein DFS33DRAFT_1276243 [Desarmillaria ectypa]